MKKTTLISKYSKRILYVFFLFFLGKNFLYAQKVGINTTTPTNDLHIISTADPVRLAGMQTGSDADSIVTINSTGLLKRRNTNTLFNSFAWRLIGNSGTNPTTNFLGTTDNVPFNIRVNNIRSGYFSENHLFLGYDAGRLNTSAESSFIGVESGYSNTSGEYNVGLGKKSLRLNTTGGYNTGLGTSALASNTTGSYNTAVGTASLLLNTTGANNTALGVYALTNNTIGTNNTALGLNTLSFNTSGSYNTGVGQNSLYNNTTGAYNTAVGNYSSAFNTTGENNTSMGYAASSWNTSGSRNSTYGYYAGYSASGSIYNDNSYFGYFAGGANTSGSNNTGFGSEALKVVTTGSNNTAFGYRAGVANITGANNTFLGYGADGTSFALTNATAIGYNAKVATNNSLVLGGTGADLVNVGIGNTSPSNTLHITPSAGTDPLRVENIRSGSTADSILTTTSTGLVKKITIAALSNRLGFNFWSLTGNTGTSSGTNFVGTTDAQALILKSNNIEGLRVATNGYVGVNTVAPTGVLHATSSSAANSVLLERTHTIAATASVNLRLLGNYAAGTTPAHTSGTGISFRMKDNVQAETPEAAIRLLHGSAVGKGHLEFITSDDVNGSANVRMHINEGGKVGIGVTNPGKILVLRDNDVSFAPTTAQLLTGYAANPVTSTLINSVEFSEITTGTVGMSIDHYDGGAALAGGTSNNRLDISAINSGTRAAVATFTNNGNFGVGTATPNTKADIDGAVAIRSSSTAVTVDNQAITVGNRSYIKLTGDATPSSRTVTLSAGLSDGQILIISVIGTGINGIELADSGNLNLSGLMQLDNGDTIQLIWDGTSWNEITRSSN